MPSAAAESAAVRMDGRVRVEARFSVGEYEVVILSASDALALDTWLKQHQYQIPAGAEPILRPYVQAGMKFFVARVDVSKVKMENGMAMLSPLRFHYDSETFSLPVRLGLLNSAGTQDLLVHILARGKRYQVANYPNVEIPTNYDVSEAARDSFGAFYAALFDRTVAGKPGAVVTEYAWDASTCDPCPTPALEPGSVATLGADALALGANGQPMGPLKGAVQLGDVLTGNKLPGAAQVLAGARATLAACYEKIGRDGSLDVELHLAVDKKGNVGAVKTTGPKGLDLAFQDCVASTTRQLRFSAPTGGAAKVEVRLAFQATRLPAAAPVINPYGFVLTRLHARYGKDALGQDLVFREAPPIAGGREEPGRPEQKHDAEAAGVNNFQARYAIRHPWKGPIACEHPQRGRWGGPPSGEAGDTSAKPALKVAFAPRGQIDLTAILEGGPPDLRTPAALPGPAAVEATAAGCACEAASGERPGGGAGIAAALLGLAAARRRRRARG
jgi:MYXO-CTERM domain-containing protein